MERGSELLNKYVTLHRNGTAIQTLRLSLCNAVIDAKDQLITDLIPDPPLPVLLLSLDLSCMFVDIYVDQSHLRARHIHKLASGLKHR